MSSGPEQPRTRRQRVRHVIRQLVIASTVIVLVGVYLYFGSVDHAPAPRQVAASSAPIPVGVITVEARDFPMEWSYLAQTEASQVVPIRARVSGYLLEFAFEEGQTVEQGQVIYRIDPEPFEVARDQALAQLTAARARLQRAEQQLQRIQGLVDRRAASASELEEWQAEQQVASADVRLQEARLAQAELELSYTTIRAPLTGVIGENLQDVGSFINPATGDATLTTMRQVDPMFVRFSVSEQDLLRWQRLVSAGAVSDIPAEQLTVEILLPDGRPHPHLGRINYVDVAVDPATGTAVVRVTVPNPEGNLRPGQFVTARVMGATRIDATLVPQSAVVQTPAGTNVYVVDDQEIAQSRSVEPGQWAGDQWIIESGLQPGDRVIVDHLLHVRPGIRVAPSPVSRAATDTAATDASGTGTRAVDVSAPGAATLAPAPAPAATGNAGGGTAAAPEGAATAAAPDGAR